MSFSFLDLIFVEDDIHFAVQFLTLSSGEIDKDFWIRSFFSFAICQQGIELEFFFLGSLKLCWPTL